MVTLIEGRVYRAWALVTRRGRGTHRLIDVQAEAALPYAVIEWKRVGEEEVAARRVPLDGDRLRELNWPEVDLLYTSRIDVPWDDPVGPLDELPETSVGLLPAAPIEPPPRGALPHDLVDGAGVGGNRLGGL